jgi:hypothetical protein
MATFDQLPAEQKAIIELVVQRGRSYQALADALQISQTRVRELARDALVELSPRTAARVDSEWRGQVADYLLGQQSGPESTATRSHLRRSESARSWAFSVLDSLDGLFGDGERPEVPEPGDEESPRRGRERKPAAAAAPAPTPERKPERKPEPRPAAARKEPLRKPEPEERPARAGGALSPAAQSALRRRRLIGGLATLVVVGAIVAGVLLLTGGGDNKKTASTSTTSTTATQAKVIGQLPLKGLGKYAKSAQGIAVIAQRGNTPQLIMQAQLPPSQRRQAYEVWLYNSVTDAVSLGASTANSKGQFQGQGQLPANWRRYKFVDVSLETIDSNLKHSGNSVLRGALADLQAPTQGTSTTPGGASATPTAP